MEGKWTQGWCYRGLKESEEDSFECGRKGDPSNIMKEN